MRIILISLLLCASNICAAQRFSTESVDFKLELEIKQVNDSLEISFSLLNKTNDSFFYGEETQVYYQWWSSSSGKLMELQIGTDLKVFTENTFSVKQLLASETLKDNVKIPMNRNKFSLNVKVDFFVSNKISDTNISGSKLKKNGGRWLWNSFHVPITLD